MAQIRIRPAASKDVLEIHAMIRELARFEKLEDQVISTPQSIRDCLFGDHPIAEALVVEPESKPEELVGFAIYFHNFSTFVGRPGLYLEDVYVRPSFRQQGIGKAILVELAKIARDRDCGRFEWSVLDWNSNAIAFYEGLGADVLKDWRIVRLTKDGIEQLANQEN